MKALLVKSIPLSTETVTAWKSTEHDIRFMKRSREIGEWRDIARHFEAVVNLGNSEGVTWDGGVIVINSSNVIAPIMKPAALRRSALAHLLPPFPQAGEPYWDKGHGRHDQNKTFHPEGWNGDINVWTVPENRDYQKHIDGQVYRVLTVGRRVVQVARHNGDRTYEWVGVDGAPGLVKDIARYATTLISKYTIVGWDVIYDEPNRQAFILEANFCPGMSEPTAARVLNEVQLLINGEAPNEPHYAFRDARERFGN